MLNYEQTSLNKNHKKPEKNCNCYVEILILLIKIVIFIYFLSFVLAYLTIFYTQNFAFAAIKFLVNCPSLFVLVIRLSIHKIRNDIPFRNLYHFQPHFMEPHSPLYLCFLFGNFFLKRTVSVTF